MRDGFPVHVHWVAARQAKRFQTRGADSVCAALPLWQPRCDKYECVFVQIIETCWITFQHALELAPRRGQIGVEIQRWIRARRIPASPGPLRITGIQGVFPTGACHP